MTDGRTHPHIEMGGPIYELAVQNYLNKITGRVVGLVMVVIVIAVAKVIKSYRYQLVLVGVVDQKMPVAISCHSMFFFFVYPNWKKDAEVENDSPFVTSGWSV